MNKGLKKGLKITGVTVAVILVFMLVLPFMFKDKVITIVKKEANSPVHRPTSPLLSTACPKRRNSHRNLCH